MHTHGGRARILQDNEVSIDVAFLASPSVDKNGNVSTLQGPSAFGAAGYAITDADYAKTIVALTDNYVDKVDRVTIEGKKIDYICVVDKIGDPTKIVDGTTQVTRNPIGLKIASLATQVILNSPYYKNGMSFQTGAGGISLAVAESVKSKMKNDGIKGSFASGGITNFLVQMHELGLFEEL